jgi:hypothetical protein
VHRVWRSSLRCLAERARRKRAGRSMRDGGRRGRRCVDVLGGNVSDGVL